jgi:hypothetical protein
VCRSSKQYLRLRMVSLSTLRAWWLTVSIPRINRHLLKHVSTSLARDTYTTTRYTYRPVLFLRLMGSFHDLTHAFMDRRVAPMVSCDFAV